MINIVIAKNLSAAVGNDVFGCSKIEINYTEYIVI